MIVPRLKSLTCAAKDDRLVVSRDPRQQVELADPDGRIRSLLMLLAEGGRTVDQLAQALGVPETEAWQAVETLDGLGWLENADAPSPLDDARRERHFSNLAFFDCFTTLDRSREQLQQLMSAAHVLVLGVGGLGSGVVQHLAGLGVGRLTLLDIDVVATRNFARQFTYTPADLGKSKVERVAAWVERFDPSVAVKAVHAEVTGPDVVTALLDKEDNVDLVVSAIDQPDEVDEWVNRACVGAGVPYIRGGLAHMQGMYWSVDPGRSSCRECLELRRQREVEGSDEPHVVTWPLILRQDERVNRATGPIAGMLAALVALEAQRYLTRFVEPVSAGNYQLINFTGAAEITTDPWPRDPDCPVCATAP